MSAFAWYTGGATVTQIGAAADASPRTVLGSRLWARWSRGFFGGAAPTLDSPLDLSPAVGFARGDYTAAAPGTWTASAGGSNITCGGSTPIPTATSGCPTFAENDAVLLNAALTSGTCIGNGNCHVFAVIETTSIANTALSSAWQNGGQLFGDDDNFVALAVRRAGAGPFTYYLMFGQWDGSSKVAEIEITSLLNGSGAGTIIAQGRKTGGFLQVRANNLAWVTGNACGNMSNTLGFFQTTRNAGLAGTMLDIYTWTSALSDANADDLYLWAADVYTDAAWTDEEQWLQAVQTDPTRWPALATVTDTGYPAVAFDADASADDSLVTAGGLDFPVGTTSLLLYGGFYVDDVSADATIKILRSIAPAALLTIEIVNAVLTVTDNGTADTLTSSALSVGWHHYVLQLRADDTARLHIDEVLADTTAGFDTSVIIAGLDSIKVGT